MNDPLERLTQNVMKAAMKPNEKLCDGHGNLTWIGDDGETMAKLPCSGCSACKTELDLIVMSILAAFGCTQPARVYSIAHSDIERVAQAFRDEAPSPLLAELKRFRDDAYAFSAQITYLEAVINCAQGRDYVRLPGIEEHALVRKMRLYSYKIEHIRKAINETEAEGLGTAALPMVLYCPKCQHQHVDKDEWATRHHKTHLCGVCKHEWRPANVPTYGVLEL